MIDETGGRVTVVVMTRDRWPDLRNSLARHRAPVIVVDNGSSDGTPQNVRTLFPHVQVIALGRNHGSPARDVGVEHARTPYVAFADDDSWWGPDALRRAADALDAHPRLGLLAARMLVEPDGRLDPICEQMASAPLGTAADLPGPSIFGFLACGVVARRQAYRGAGGYDDVIFFAGEEERLTLDLLAAGWGLAYVDSVVAHHRPSAVRDPAARRVRADRNRLLTAVLRRPWSVVARIAGRDLRRGAPGRIAVLLALRALPRALRRRRRLPRDVEVTLRRLEAAETCVHRLAPSVPRSSDAG